MNLSQYGSLSIIGIYPDAAGAGEAIDRLERSGFRTPSISMLMPAKKTAEIATVGAAGGAVVGGSLGWLAGIGALAIPGVGPFVAAGPLLSALAGIGIGGTVGGITGALAGLGVPEYEARRYEGFVKEGRVLLSVHVDDAIASERAKRVLRDTGAKEITTAREAEASVVYSTRVRPMTRADDSVSHQ